MKTGIRNLLTGGTYTLLAACASPLTDGGGDQAELRMVGSQMSSSLRCMAQRVYDQQPEPFSRETLGRLKLRVGDIADKSGKTAFNVPSENPILLQGYVLESIAKTGLFTVMSTDDGTDLSRGPANHPPTTHRADYLLDGALIGDAEIKSSNVDINVNFAAINLLASHDQRIISQRLQVELVSNNKGQIFSRTVRDPYTNTVRRAHMVITAEVTYPEASATGAGNIERSGRSLGVGANVRSAYNRPAALQTTADAIVFELLRRMTDMYAESETCLSNVHAMSGHISMPRYVNGVIVSGRSTAPGKLSSYQSTQVPKVAQVPQAPKAAPVPQAPKTTRSRRTPTRTKKVAPAPAIARDSVKTTKEKDQAVAAFRQTFPVHLFGTWQPRAWDKLYQDVSVVLETSPSHKPVKAAVANRRFTITSYPAVFYNIAAGKAACRNFMITFTSARSPGAILESMGRACRHPQAAIWLVTAAGSA